MPGNLYGNGGGDITWCGGEVKMDLSYCSGSFYVRALTRRCLPKPRKGPAVNSVEKFAKVRFFVFIFIKSASEIS